MFRDVPECSGMFRDVPCSEFYRRPNVSDGVVNGIATLFSLDHKLYASDYDSYSDSVASENQP